MVSKGCPRYLPVAKIFDVWSQILHVVMLISHGFLVRHEGYSFVRVCRRENAEFINPPLRRYGLTELKSKELP